MTDAKTLKTDTFTIPTTTSYNCLEIDLSNISMADSKNQKSCSIKLNETLEFQKNPKLSFDSRLEFLYPTVDENKNPLPRCLSTTDKSPKAIIDPDNPFQIEYTSEDVSVEDIYNFHDNANIRANNIIPLTTGIYYFEIKVLSKGEKGRPYIGLTPSSSNLERAPGWDWNTYGYHGDDGKSFANQSQGQTYGPTFSTSDVVGCGVNFENQTCFFTKNGSSLGIAFRDMPMTGLYPTVGVGSRNESLEVNFGQHPFVYNISMEKILHEAHTADLKMKRKNSIKRKLR